MTIFGVFWGYHHLRKHPCIYNIYPLKRDHVERKLIIFQPSVFRGYVTLWGVKHQILWWGIIPRCILTSPFLLALLFAVFSWLKQKLLGGWTNPSEKSICQIGSFPQIRVKIKNVWNHHPEKQCQRLRVANHWWFETNSCCPPTSNPTREWYTSHSHSFTVVFGFVSDRKMLFEKNRQNYNVCLDYNHLYIYEHGGVKWNWF